MAVLLGDSVVKADSYNDWFPALSISVESVTPLDT